MKRKSKIGDVIRVTYADPKTEARTGKIVSKSKTYFTIEDNSWRWHVKHTASGGRRYYIYYLSDEEAMLYKLENA